jgi:hypothetical protein
MSTATRDRHPAPLCEGWLDRIVTIAASGRSPIEDAEVAEHVGSCLACFRVVSELRDLPAVEAALRAEPAGEDPGEAFWRRFPGDVGAAWDRARAPRPNRAASAVRTLGAWLRRPLPAAFVGATATAAVALVVATRPAHRPEGGRSIPPSAAHVARSVLDDDLGDPELEEWHRGLSAAETIEQLDDAELTKLAAAWGAEGEI